MSFSLATGIKLILPIKTVAYDQRSSVSRLRKDFKSLFSHWLSNRIKSFKVKQLEYQKEHQIKNFKLFKKSETLTRDSRTKPQNFENLGPIRTGRSPNLAVRVSLTLTLLLIFLIKNFIFVKYWWFFKLRLFSGRKFLQHHLSKVLFATIFYWQWLDSAFFSE